MTDEREQIENALQEAIGLHGAWVLAVERYDDNGGTYLDTHVSATGSGWAHLGMAQCLTDFIDNRLVNTAGEDDD